MRGGEITSKAPCQDTISNHLAPNRTNRGREGLRKGKQGVLERKFSRERKGTPKRGDKEFKENIKACEGKGGERIV